MSGNFSPKRCPKTQEVISYVTMESDTQGYHVAKAVRRVLNNFSSLISKKTVQLACPPPKRRAPPLSRKSKTTTTPDNIQGYTVIHIKPTNEIEYVCRGRVLITLFSLLFLQL